MSPRALAVPRPTVLRSGPWKGVYDTSDPFDASPQGYLQDLLNGYIPDPRAGSGVRARRGFQLLNSDTALTAAFPGLVGPSNPLQAFYTHTQLDGTILNFAVAAGRLYRLDAFGTSDVTPVDVTPVGVTINNAAKVYVTSCIKGTPSTESVIVVNDGVNRPWIGSNLGGAPITGTYIDYDGLGHAWTAFGAPVVWQGSVFFILSSVNGISRREDIAWGEPGSPSTGYQQTNFDNNMTLVSHSTGALYVLVATNAALFYFRANSIGVIYGGIANLATTNTQDAVSVNVGCTSPASVQTFGQTVYFCDALARPFRFTPGSVPEPIWLQARRQIEAHNIQGNVEGQASAIEPWANLYVAAVSRPTNNGGSYPRECYVFDAETGTYMGRWAIFDANDGNGGIQITAMGVYVDPITLDRRLLVGGRAVTDDASQATSAHTFVWAAMRQGESAETGIVDRYAASSLAHLIRTQVTTDRLGEDENTVIAVDRVSAITANAQPCTVTIVNTTTSGTTLGTVTPAASQDGTYRLLVGCDGVQGRGPAVVMTPTVGAFLDSWMLHRVDVTGTASLAGPEDP